jgi:S-layer homology domain
MVGKLTGAKLIITLKARTSVLRAIAVTLGLAAGLEGGAGALPAPPNSAGAASPAGGFTVCVNGNTWVDGGYEATSSADLTNPNYSPVFSTHFPSGHPAGTPPSGTPLCNVGYLDCNDGTDGLLTPRTGSSWAWFGGNNTDDGVLEIAYADQTITFPTGASSVTLNFYLRIGFVTSPFTDTLEVQVDGVTQQTFVEPSTPESSYTLRSLDLTAFADGTPHTIRFSYTQAPPADSNKANFDVDDVSLDIVCPPVIPVALAVDPAPTGNGVLEPGEIVSMEPTWKNVTGAPVPLSGSLTGTSSDFTGPSGAAYDNPDNSGDYGTIAAGASAKCTDCYTVEVIAASRPARHWDATIEETAGTTPKTWMLHVGDSFPDVPTSYPFYSYIETIFHKGITGGCGGTSYCPDGDVTRAQMAAFLLKAKNGKAYTPPPCTGTVFTDVPCTGGIFDPWIEDLHGQGITNGCGGSLYCPGNPVTRAQMAAFLLKTKNGSAYTPPPCTGTVFTDVPCTGGTFDPWIEDLAGQHITGGCGGGLYCPGNPNTRGQMAVFLTKTFGLLLYGP